MDLKYKHYSTRHCFVCGTVNEKGLHAEFYENEKGEIVGKFTPDIDFCGFPTRMHGGAIAAILDETAGRAINVSQIDAFAVTSELSIKYRRPVPLGKELTSIGRLVSESTRGYIAESEIIDDDGKILASAKGTFAKLSLDKITDNCDLSDESFAMEKTTL